MSTDRTDRTEQTAALNETARALHRLGLGTAETSFGAIEALSMAIGESNDRIASSNYSIASAIDRLAESLADGLHHVGTAIEGPQDDLEDE